MMRLSTLRLGVTLSLIAWTPAIAADAPKGALRPPPVVQTFVARGPSSHCRSSCGSPAARAA